MTSPDQFPQPTNPYSDDQFDQAEFGGLTPFDPEQFAAFRKYDAEANAWQAARDEVAGGIINAYRIASEQAVVQKTSVMPPDVIDESGSYQELIQGAFASYMRGDPLPFPVLLEDAENSVLEKVVVHD